MQRIEETRKGVVGGAFSSMSMVQTKKINQVRKVTASCVEEGGGRRALWPR